MNRCRMSLLVLAAALVTQGCPGPDDPPSDAAGSTDIAAEDVPATDEPELPSDDADVPDANDIPDVDAVSDGVQDTSDGEGTEAPDVPSSTDTDALDPDVDGDVPPPPEPGDTCDDPFAVGSLPFTAEGDTLGATASYGYASDVCPGETGGWGTASPDHAYAFTPPETATYEITLEAEFDSNLYVVVDCDDVDGTCIAGDERVGLATEHVVVALEAGQTVFVIVDGYSNSDPLAGAYTLTIGPPCTPSCEPGACGDDGCGGSCGCGGGEVCFDESCCSPACDGASCGATSDDGCGGQCGCGDGSVCSDGACCIPECDGTACGPGSTDGCGGECGCLDGLVCDPEAGLCVDSLPGDTCDDAFPVDALPFSASGTTGDAYPHYGYSSLSCPGETSGWGLGSNDEVYALVAPETATYAVSLVAEFDSNLYAVTDCANIDGTCLAADEEVGSGAPEALILFLLVGQTAYIIVDGWGGASNQSGPYTLTIGAPCVPSCESKACGPDGCAGSCGSCTDGQFCQAGACETLGTECAPVGPVACGETITGLSNSMPGASNAWSTYSCAAELGDLGDYGASPEVVFTLTTEESTVVTVTGTDDQTADLIVLTDTGAGCVDTGPETCATGTSTVTFGATAGTTYYLIWDSWSKDSPVVEGFTMSVQCCAPSCDDIACGDDGCGGSCGSCDGGTVCQEGACATLPASCQPIDTLGCGEGEPTTLVGLSNSMVGATKAFANYGACQLFAADDYAASPEVVWEFSTPSNQLVTITGANDGALDITVLKDLGAGCGEGSAGCVVQGGSKVTFEAEGGTLYYLVWDSWLATVPIVADFSMTLSCCEAVCTPGVCDVANGCGGTCGCDGGEVCFEETCCAPACDLIACGPMADDGCGGTCGCAAGKVCSPGTATCEDPPPGDSCADALPLAEGETVVSDNTGFSDQYSTLAACLGSTFDAGGGQPDVAFAFVPAEDGLYDITMPDYWDGLGPSLVYVTTDCDDFAGSACIGYADFFGSGGGGSPVALSLDLEAGVTYYLIVDSFNGMEIGPFKLSIEKQSP